MKSVAYAYAEKALGSIRQMESESNSKDYGRLCFIFPSMVLVNGLRNTIVFFQRSTLHQRYLNDLAEALGIETWESALSKNNMTDYRDLSKRALQAAVWFKRYAEVILKVETSVAMEE